jgi:hypothetical protein
MDGPLHILAPECEDGVAELGERLEAAFVNGSSRSTIIAYTNRSGISGPQKQKRVASPRPTSAPWRGLTAGVSHDAPDLHRT